MKSCQEIITPNPECCLGTDKVGMIAQRMQTEDIDTLFVVENYMTQKLIGIVTDRDLAVRVVGENRDAKSTKAADIMTSHPVVCHPADDLDITLAMMACHHINQIPIVDEKGQIIGMVAQVNVTNGLNNDDKAEQMSKPDLISSLWRTPVQVGSDIGGLPVIIIPEEREIPIIQSLFKLQMMRTPNQMRGERDVKERKIQHSVSK